VERQTFPATLTDLMNQRRNILLLQNLLLTHKTILNKSGQKKDNAPVYMLKKTLNLGVIFGSMVNFPFRAVTK